MKYPQLLFSLKLSLSPLALPHIFSKINYQFALHIYVSKFSVWFPAMNVANYSERTQFSIRLSSPLTPTASSGSPQTTFRFNSSLKMLTTLTESYYMHHLLQWKDTGYNSPRDETHRAEPGVQMWNFWQSFPCGMLDGINSSNHCA